jgi:thiol-disulfide isomerase/thioredoxin
MKNIFVVMLVTASIFALSVAFGQDTIAVSLKTAVLPDTGQLTGITNIFFARVDSLHARYPSGWRNVEAASLLSNDEFFPINIIRYSDHSDSIHYVVDTDSDSNFENEPTLRFRRLPHMLIADAPLKITRKSNSESWNVTYQVILADRYSYARIAEYRVGTLSLAHDHYSILLRPLYRKYPYFSLSGETLCFVDMNSDGYFANNWRITDGGEILASEEVSLSEPFIVAGQKWEAVWIDSAGSTLLLKRSSKNEALSIGFQAPTLQFEDLNGLRHDLTEARGKVVLLTFWSTDCPFSEKVRPSLDSMIHRYDSRSFSAFALSRETDVKEIRSYLEDHPYEGTLGIADSTFWHKYNSRTITPLFYLIDPNGTIALICSGASMVPVLQSMIQRLLVVR